MTTVMQGKHWVIFGAILGSAAAEMLLLPHWSDITPKVVGAVVISAISGITALFADRPRKPWTPEMRERHRRKR